MKTRFWLSLDYILVGSAFCICSLGVLAIASASRTDPRPFAFAQRQILWVLLGFCLAGLVAASDYRKFTGQSKLIYGAIVILLLSVAVLGAEAKGAQRWIRIGAFQLQPSELAKVGLVISLASVLPTIKQQGDTFLGALRGLAHVGLPTAVILFQPDLGTALVLLAVWFMMAVTAGLNWKPLLCLVFALLVLFVGAWKVGFIKDYQKDRLVSFLDPQADPNQSGYHAIQSKIAVGSGRLFGKGLFRGPQSELNFIPEQHTDFVFTVIAEEMGFAGCSLLLALYGILIWRLIVLARRCEELSGQLIAMGVAAIFTCQVFCNVGMTVSLTPVVGIPLPLASYGGSSMLAQMVALGLAQSVHRQPHEIRFGAG
jgi:rod shape determining protein RodA